MKKETNHLDSSLKLLAKTSFIVLVGLFLSRILTYIYRIIIARFFGPEVYGLFSLALVMFSLFVTFSSLGLTEGLLRYIPFYRGKKQINKIRYILRVSLIILIISGLISTTLLFLFSNIISISIFHNYNLIIYLRIFSFLIPISIFSSIFLSVIKAYEKVSWYSFIQNILQNVIKLALLILMLFLGFKTSAIIFSYFLSILFTLIISYLLCRYKLSEVFLRPIIDDKNKKEARQELLSYSWPIIFLGVIGNLLYWIDSFSIGYFKSVVEVGIYNAAIPIAALFLITSEIFMQLFFPLINKEYSKRNIKLIRDITKQVKKWIFIINLPALLIMFVFPGVLINILFGENYLAAENALRLLSVGMFFSSIFVVYSQLLSMKGKSKLILIDILIFSLLNLILNLILVPLYGINGAAFSTMLSGVLVNVTFMIQANKIIPGIPLIRGLKKIFLVSLIPFVLLIILKQFLNINLFILILTGFLFILVYLLLIFATRCLDKNDFMILRAIKKKIFAGYFRKIEI